jgi:hypothetical protein
MNKMKVIEIFLVFILFLTSLIALILRYGDYYVTNPILKILKAYGIASILHVIIIGFFIYYIAKIILSNKKNENK